MNPLQSKIEQTAKEYLSCKTIADKEAISAKKEKDKNKEQIAKDAVGKTKEEIHGMYFDTFASLELLVKDMFYLKSKLYHQIELVKDVIEVPQEILELVKDYRQPLMYAIIGDEKKLIEEELYNTYKQNYILGAIQMTKTS